MNSAERYFARAEENSGPGHAFLLEGEDPGALLETAGRIARRVQCEKGTGCGTCASCRAALSGNHPDIITVTHEKPDTLSVGEIRRQLVDDMEIRPYRSTRKIYLVPDAGKMNPQAQNALLKTLEEPPAYGMILLLADNRNRFLPTVLSRLVVLRADEAENEGEEDAEAPGSARLIGLLRRLQTADAAELAKAAVDLKAEGVSAEEAFELLTSLWRDELIVKAGGKTKLYFPEAADMLEDWARALSWKDEDRMFTAIGEGKAKLKANGSPDVVLEVFLLELRELLRKA